MNLKKLEAYGFKSFADKLTLDFNTGVTCIVGPNGCGKSNVSDAIRWVLGEQSPKNLRGKSMQEVIFNGTASRKALGFCEVSLTFDNTERTYAVDSDEVIIKRKLYRSGDSEYYINNDPSRLKDILDLFRDTGIGKDGYSVVGQGKIDSFLSAKPEDRRQIFEEAAGISKYKAKRLESQRKLDRAGDNLLRIKDKLAVYEERIAPLEKQSKEALKARELKERLKYNEVNHFIYLAEHNVEERERVSARLDRVNVSLADAEKRAQKLQADYTEVQNRLKGLDGEYKRLSEEYRLLSMKLVEKNGKNDLNLQRLEQVKAELSRLEGEIAQKNAAINDHTASREANKREQGSCLTEYIEAQKAVEASDNRFNEMEVSVEAKKKEIDVTNEMLLSSADMWGQINGGLSKLKTEIALLEKSVEENDLNYDDKQRELRENTKRLNDITDELDRLKADRLEKKDVKKDIDKQYSDSFSLYSDGQDKYAELRDTVMRLENRLEFLEQSKKSYLGYDAAVRFLMNAEKNIKDKLLGVVGNIISVSPQFATAIEVALGGNISNMITQNQQDTSMLIDYLNVNRGGRGTFLPLDSMRPRPLEDAYMDALDEPGCYGIASDLVKYDRKFRPAIETLLGRVVVVDTKDTAIGMTRRYRSAFRIVTLDGAHYAINGAVSGGKKEGKDTRMLGVESELNDVKRKLADYKNMMQVIVEENGESKAKLDEMEKASKVLEGIIAKLDKDISVAEQKNEYLKSENARLTSEAEKLKKAIDDGKKEISVKQRLFDAESEKIDSTSNARVDTNDLLARLAAELKECEKERDKASAERTDRILKVKQLENKLSDIEKNIDLSGRNIDRLNLEILDATARTKVLGAEQERLEAEIARIAAEQTDNDELKEMQAQIEGLETQKWEYTKEQEALRGEEVRNNEILATLSGTKAKAEAALEKLEGDMVFAGNKVQEDYGLDYDSALEFKDADYDDEKGVQEAKLLRRDLARMGDINEKAIEDLAAMNAEYAELKIHYDDVTEAIASLEATIKELTVKMETNFSESFEKIKVNFAEVFTELFGGGRGMLDLDIQKGMSVLDAGIIIAAEPPGKRLQNIDLLSGGERAMTAIALIFAIIKLHPMPFCVLDEVDAPLDDANADTYAKYLKKFSKVTQFIIVSHRKPTMELADELYGITMQEKGVSKFFTVKLSDALQMVKQ